MQFSFYVYSWELNLSMLKLDTTQEGLILAKETPEDHFISLSTEELMLLGWSVEEMTVLDLTNQEFTLMCQNLEIGS